VRRVGILALLIAFGIGAASASADTVSFDFRTPGLPSENVWQADGVSVTATAQSILSTQKGYPQLTFDQNRGLGVISGTSFLKSVDPLINYGESIQFAFDPTIVVHAITLTEMQNILGFGDHVLLSYFDGTSTQKLGAVQGYGTGRYDEYTYVLPTPVTAVTFTIGADLRLLNSFGVAGITVDYSPGSGEPATGGPSPVGVPAAVWEGIVLLGGLGGLRLWMQRRRVVGA
jgi:hypothetical protein